MSNQRRPLRVGDRVQMFNVSHDGTVLAVEGRSVTVGWDFERTDFEYDESDLELVEIKPSRVGNDS